MFYQVIKTSERLPDYGKPVFVMMEWESGKKVGAYLKRVDEDDCDWRTVDDDSEISYSLNVIEWLEVVDDVQGLSKDIAEKILKVRDALAVNDSDEAYHWLYQIGSPNFDKDSEDVWRELELISERIKE